MRQRDPAESAVVVAWRRGAIHIKTAKKPFTIEFIRASRIASVRGGPPAGQRLGRAGTQHGQAGECRAADDAATQDRAP